MAVGDPYYEDLITKGAAEAGPGRLGGFLGKGTVKGAAGGLAMWLAIGRLLDGWNQRAERGIKQEAIRGQAKLASPENLYYQAALPGAKAEEEQARQMLFSQILGGVVGPSLAAGERLIGNR